MSAKMREHPNCSDQRIAIDWARRVLGYRYMYVILDTETTGLGKNDEIIQMAVIDLNGTVLFNENIRPTKKKRISQESTDIHGLTMKHLANSPTFREFSTPLEKVIGNRKIITYNVSFDVRLYQQTWRLAGGFMPKGEWQCAMIAYAKFVGEWNKLHEDYKWQKLEGGDHSALGDCMATLEVIKFMASATKLKRWYEFWVGR
jgi:DNA polymerase-3 subunit epsilon